MQRLGAATKASDRRRVTLTFVWRSEMHKGLRVTLSGLPQGGMQLPDRNPCSHQPTTPPMYSAAIGTTAPQHHHRRL